ncbi:hypothetical protein DMP17_22215 [Pseudonocardia sp. TMWB2A]
MRRIITPKDAALERARAEGLQVLEGRYRVEKYRGDSTDPADLVEVVELAPNLFLTAGLTALWKLAAGQSATAFGANTRLAVGDGTTAPAAAQTDLAGTNKYRQQLDAAPTVAGNQLQMAATFGTGVANFPWREVGVVNAASGGDMVSRALADLGTKTTSATWILNWALAIN